jgi:hypothetical protein
MPLADRSSTARQPLEEEATFTSPRALPTIPAPAATAAAEEGEEAYAAGVKAVFEARPISIRLEEAQREKTAATPSLPSSFHG